MAMVDTRDFLRNCQAPILVLPDNVPAHPYDVAMETVHLAPQRAGEPVSMEGHHRQNLASGARHIRTFLRAHRPVAAA
jgi:hypothetical protein